MTIDFIGISLLAALLSGPLSGIIGAIKGVDKSTRMSKQIISRTVAFIFCLFATYMAVLVGLIAAIRRDVHQQADIEKVLRSLEFSAIFIASGLLSICFAKSLLQKYGIVKILFLGLLIITLAYINTGLFIAAFMPPQ